MVTWIIFFVGATIGLPMIIGIALSPRASEQRSVEWLGIFLGAVGAFVLDQILDASGDGRRESTLACLAIAGVAAALIDTAISDHGGGAYVEALIARAANLALGLALVVQGFIVYEAHDGSIVPPLVVLGVMTALGTLGLNTAKRRQQRADPDEAQPEPSSGRLGG